MATIELTVTGADIGTATILSTLDKANSDRLVEYLAATYGLDPDGNPRDLKGMLAAFWDGIIEGTRGNVVRFEQEQAAQVARNAVQPLAVTVT